MHAPSTPHPLTHSRFGAQLKQVREMLGEKQMQLDITPDAVHWLAR